MKRILAVDPGSTKCGIAVVAAQGGKSNILFRHVVPTSELAGHLRQAVEDFDPDLVVVGDGTRSKDVQQVVRDTLPGKSMLIVDEHDTSIRARERYWMENPRRGWRRFVPSTLQVPKEPVDDYVAVILAERVLNAGD